MATSEIFEITLAAKNTEINNLKIEVNQKNEIINRLQNDINQKNEQSTRISQEIDQKDREIGQLREKLENAIHLQQEFCKTMNMRNNEINSNNNQVDQNQLDASVSSQIQLNQQDQKSENQLLPSYIISENNQIQQPQEQFEIFEAFYILGINKYQQEKILYKYFNNNKHIEENILMQFAFPNGNIFKQIDFDQANNLLHQGNQLDISSQFSSFTLKSFENFVNYSIRSQELISLYNPDKVLFSYCLSLEDFVYIDNQFYQNQVIYLFLTHFPIQYVFKKLLQYIQTIIKLRRQLICNIQGNILLSGIDDSIIICQYILDDVMKQISKQKILIDKSQITINLTNNFQNRNDQNNQNIETTTIKYVVPNNLFIENRAEITHIAIQIFSKKTFQFLLTSILLEFQVIIICEFKPILTALIQFFHQILYPIIWPHPVIYMLPQSMINHLNNQLPFICGVNYQLDVKLKENLIQKKNKLIILEINHNNEQQVYANKESVKLIQEHQVILPDTIGKYFNKINSIDQVSYNYNNLQNSIDILININTFIQSEILSLFPERDSSFIQNQSLKYERLNELINQLMKQTSKNYGKLQQEIIKTRYFKEFAKYFYLRKTKQHI